MRISPDQSCWRNQPQATRRYATDMRHLCHALGSRPRRAEIAEKVADHTPSDTSIRPPSTVMLAPRARKEPRQRHTEQPPLARLKNLFSSGLRRPIRSGRCGRYQIGTDRSDGSWINGERRLGGGRASLRSRESGCLSRAPSNRGVATIAARHLESLWHLTGRFFAGPGGPAVEAH